MAFDLDAVIAERDAQTPFTFTFDGTEYSMPSDIGVDVLDLLSEGQVGPALQNLLGAEQWKQISDSPKVLGVAALSSLVEAYVQHVGVGDVGESSASTGSSGSTAGPSNRISPGIIPATPISSVSSADDSPGGDSES